MAELAASREIWEGTKRGTGLWLTALAPLKVRIWEEEYKSVPLVIRRGRGACWEKQ